MDKVELKVKYQNSMEMGFYINKMTDLSFDEIGILKKLVNFEASRKMEKMYIPGDKHEYMWVRAEWLLAAALVLGSVRKIRIRLKALEEKGYIKNALAHTKINANGVLTKGCYSCIRILPKTIAARTEAKEVGDLERANIPDAIDEDISTEGQPTIPSELFTEPKIPTVNKSLPNTGGKATNPNDAALAVFNAFMKKGIFESPASNKKLNALVVQELIKKGVMKHTADMTLQKIYPHPSRKKPTKDILEAQIFVLRWWADNFPIQAKKEFQENNNGVQFDFLIKSVVSWVERTRADRVDFLATTRKFGEKETSDESRAWNTDILIELMLGEDPDKWLIQWTPSMLLSKVRGSKENYNNIIWRLVYPVGFNNLVREELNYSISETQLNKVIEFVVEEHLMSGARWIRPVLPLKNQVVRKANYIASRK